MNYSNFLENSNLFKKIYLHKWKTPSNLNKKFCNSLKNFNDKTKLICYQYFLIGTNLSF